jgi:hypothetical protein
LDKPKNLEFVDEMTRSHLSLFRRWVCANALSEMLGLGVTFLLTGLAFSRLDNLPGLTGILAAFSFAVVSGAFEATLVGLAQWWAMHPWFPRITRFAWWRGTLAGALAAYVLGYLPSMLMDLGGQSAGTPMSEPPQAVVLLLAAGLGAVGGAVLSFAQWLTLRKHSPGAGWWIPANMLAWAAGMPIIFWALDQAFKLARVWQSVALVAAALLVTGAVVGMFHGAFLVRLVAKNRDEI